MAVLSMLLLFNSDISVWMTAMDNRPMNDCGCVSIKLDLHKQLTGSIGLRGHGKMILWMQLEIIMLSKLNQSQNDLVSSLKCSWLLDFIEVHKTMTVCVTS